MYGGSLKSLMLFDAESEAGIAEEKAKLREQLAKGNIVKEAPVVEKEEELTSRGLLCLAHEIKLKQRDDARRRKIYEESRTISVEDSGIFCGDCVEYMRDHMADQVVDLTITSPPYGQARDYQGYEFDFEATANELFRVTKDGGVVVWIVGDSVVNGSETGEPFKQALFFKQVGFSLWDTMIYKKSSTIAIQVIVKVFLPLQRIIVATCGLLLNN